MIHKFCDTSSGEEWEQIAYRIGTLEVSPEHPLVRRVHAQLLVQQALQE